MPVRFAAAPVPGEFTGQPLHIPWVLLCTQGERWCGWHRTANSQKQFVELAKERRLHERTCKGGLVIAVAGQVS